MIQDKYIHRLNKSPKDDIFSKESLVAKVIGKLPKSTDTFLVRYDSVMQVSKRKYYTCRYTTIALSDENKLWKYISVKEYSKLNKKYRYNY